MHTISTTIQYIFKLSSCHKLNEYFFINIGLNILIELIKTTKQILSKRSHRLMLETHPYSPNWFNVSYCLKFDINNKSSNTKQFRAKLTVLLPYI